MPESARRAGVNKTVWEIRPLGNAAGAAHHICWALQLLQAIVPSMSIRIRPHRQHRLDAAKVTPTRRIIRLEGGLNRIDKIARKALALRKRRHSGDAPAAAKTRDLTKLYGNTHRVHASKFEGTF